MTGLDGGPPFEFALDLRREAALLAALCAGCDASLPVAEGQFTPASATAEQARQQSVAVLGRTMVAARGYVITLLIEVRGLRLNRPARASPLAGALRLRPPRHPRCARRPPKESTSVIRSLPFIRRRCAATHLSLSIEALMNFPNDNLDLVVLSTSSLRSPAKRCL
jgi:hypothetical protein